MKHSFFELYSADRHSGQNHDINRKFNFEIKHIVQFLSTYFSDFKHPEFKGVRIDLNSEGDQIRIEKPIPKIYPLARVIFPYDVQKNYFSKSPQLRKGEIIEILKKSFTYLFADFTIDETEVNSRFEAIDNLNSNFEYTVNKPKGVKGSPTKISITCELEPGFANYYLNILNKDESPRRKKLITINEYYGIGSTVSRIVSESAWIDLNTFVVLGKKGHLERVKFEYKLDTDTLTKTFNLEPDIPEKDFLEEFDLATSEDPNKIEKILTNKDFNKWHIYI